MSNLALTQCQLVAPLVHNRKVRTAAVPTTRPGTQRTVAVRPWRITATTAIGHSASAPVHESRMCPAGADSQEFLVRRGALVVDQPRPGSGRCMSAVTCVASRYAVPAEKPTQNPAAPAGGIVTEISFVTEWQDGEGIAGEELSATFASLRIDVGGEPLTKVLDNRAATIRDSIFVPLYPVAEWLVSNWWFLAHEPENPTKKRTHAFNRRHSLRTSTDGYALPDLTMTTSGARTTLRWTVASSAWTRTDFLNSGQTTVDTGQFMQDCADFIEKVTRRLVDCDIRSTFLQDEWAAIQNADDDESKFCAMSARLGWDPYDLDASLQDQLFTLADRLGDLSGEAFPVINGSAPLEDSAAILEAIEAAKPNELDLPLPIQKLYGVLEDVDGRPWDAGYDLARATRSLLGLNGQPISDTESLASALDQDIATLERVTAPVGPLSRLNLVEGVVTRGSSGSASFGLKASGDAGRRFLFCRTLAEAIYSHGDALVTKGNTERQQRNRAFAAEFLAPSAGLKAKIADSVVDDEQVDELAEEYGVSTRVILHQIENHRIAELV